MRRRSLLAGGAAGLLLPRRSRAQLGQQAVMAQPPPAGGVTNSTVNFATTTGKVVDGGVFGGMCPNQMDCGPGPSYSTPFSMVTDTDFIASTNIVAPQVFRFNTQQTTLIVADIFAGGLGSPDWTTIDTYLNNHTAFFNGRVIFGIGPAFDDTSISPSTWASYAASMANHFIAMGQEVTWWEITNESQGMGATTWMTYFRAITDALLAVNSSYVIVAPANDFWDDGGLGAALLANSTTRAQVGCWCTHNYMFAGSSPSDSAIYAQALSEFPSVVGSIRSSLRGVGISDSIPIICGETNVFLDTVNNSVWQAAVAIALQGISCFQADPSFVGQNVWSMVWDGDFGIIGNGNSSGTLATVTPQGYFSGMAGAQMAGNECGYSTTVPNIQMLASVNGSNFGIIMVNTDTSTDQTLSFAVSGHATSGAITKATLGHSFQTVPNVTTIANLSSVSVPRSDIVVLSGALA